MKEEVKRQDLERLLAPYAKQGEVHVWIARVDERVYVGVREPTKSRSGGPEPDRRQFAVDDVDGALAYLNG